MTSFIDIVAGVAAGDSPEDMGCRRIALTKSTDNGGIGVSTMWMPDEECFETAIYDSLEIGGTYIVERYPTEEEALAGHKKWLDTAKPGVTIHRIDGIREDKSVILDPKRVLPTHDERISALLHDIKVNPIRCC